MWQSEIRNGQDTAFRSVGCIGLIVVFLYLDDRQFNLSNSAIASSASTPPVILRWEKVVASATA